MIVSTIDTLTTLLFVGCIAAVVLSWIIGLVFSIGMLDLFLLGISSAGIIFAAQFVVVITDGASIINTVIPIAIISTFTYLVFRQTGHWVSYLVMMGLTYLIPVIALRVLY